MLAFSYIVAKNYVPRSSGSCRNIFQQCGRASGRSIRLTKCSFPKHLSMRDEECEIGIRREEGQKSRRFVLCCVTYEFCTSKMQRMVSSRCDHPHLNRRHNKTSTRSFLIYDVLQDLPNERARKERNKSTLILK